MFRLTRKRIYILPTGQGLVFLFALGVMMVGSVNYNNSLGYMLSFLLGSMALVSTLHTYRNLAGLGLRPGRSAPVFLGDEARLGVCLDNRRQTARPALTLGYRVRGYPRRRGFSGQMGTHLPPDALVCKELPLTANRRGWLRIETVTLITRYPLGLFRAWSPVSLNLTCLVYPRPEGDLPLPSAWEGHSHAETGRAAGQEDFSGFRGFVPGDSPRRVYWKAAARGHGLVVKLFHGGAGGERLLRWQEAGDGGDEARLSQLCRWVLDAHHAGVRYALEMPGVRLPPGNGEEHLHACLRALALHGLTQAVEP